MGDGHGLEVRIGGHRGADGGTPLLEILLKEEVSDFGPILSQRLPQGLFGAFCPGETAGVVPGVVGVCGRRLFWVERGDAAFF